MQKPYPPVSTENVNDLSADEWRRQIMLLLNKISDPKLLAIIDAVINDIYTGKLKLMM